MPRHVLTHCIVADTDTGLRASSALSGDALASLCLHPDTRSRSPSRPLPVSAVLVTRDGYP